MFRTALPSSTIVALLVAMALVAAVTPATASSATAPPRNGTERAPVGDPLRDIVAEALAANLGLREQRLAERRSAAESREALARLLPSVSLEARVSHFDGVPNVGDLVNPAYAALDQLTGTNRFPTDLDITFPPRYESHLRVVQPLFNEALRANLAVARARHDGQRLEWRAAARQLAADAQLAYLQHAAAHGVTGIYESSLDRVQENERVAERLLDAGRATPEAVHRAQAERAEVEQQLAEAREREQAAARQFNTLLRRPLDGAVESIPDSVFDRPLDITEDAAVAHGLAAREELRQSDAGIRATRAARHAATAGFIPSVATSLDYGYQGREATVLERDHVWTASLVASWSLFNGGGDLARRSAAGYEIESARVRRRDLEDQIELQIRTAHQAALVAHAAIATASVRLAAAARTFALVRRRFEEGAASPYELVDARAALTNAELNRVLTAYRYAIRLVDLERAAALRDLSASRGDGS